MNQFHELQYLLKLNPIYKLIWFCYSISLILWIFVEKNKKIFSQFVIQEKWNELILIYKNELLIDLIPQLPFTRSLLLV